MSARSWAALTALALAGCATGAVDPMDATVTDGASGDVAPPPSYASPLEQSRATDTAEPCAADLAWFRQNLWAPVFAVRCVGCHNSEGPARATRLVFRTDEAPDALSANYRITREMARTTLGGTSVLVLRPNGRYPTGHTGGALLATGGSDLQTVTDFVAHVDQPCGTTTSSMAACTGATPGAPTIRRLTASEYDHTVRDLLGVTSDEGARFVTDTEVGGYDNNLTALTVSSTLADQYAAAADRLARRAVTSLPAWLGCTPATGSESVCVRSWFERFGARAFRRPLRAGESDRYVTLFTTLLPGLGVQGAVEAVVSATLQSPGFLYRSEMGEVSGSRAVLTPYEVASELSYLLWGTMPDDALTASARAGRLATAEGIVTEARRMLDDPRSRAPMHHFFGQWLGTGAVMTVSRDPTVAPGFTPEVRASMRGAFERVVDGVVFSPTSSLADLLTTTDHTLDATLAAFHGLTVTGAGPTYPVMRFDGDRYGVLTTDAVLASHARSTTSSPIHRGKLVRERLLCQTLPPPPAGIIAQLAPVAAGLSTRDRFVAHSRNEPCLSCHRLIDPIGFAFERYDGVGRFRTTDNGMAVDTRGEIVSSMGPSVTFAGVQELVQGLAANTAVHDCFVAQWARYAFGDDPDATQRCSLEALRAQFREANLSVRELVLRTVALPHFRERAVAGAVSPTPDAGVVVDAATTSDAAVTVSDAGARDVATATDVPATSTPTMSPGITVEVMRQSEWESGYCANVTIRNAGASDVAWFFTLDLGGTLQNAWNSTTEGTTRVTFRGADWNRSLPAGRSDNSVGFCVRR